MIHYITGNIFDSNAEALVNTVNTVGVMGKGLALQFREAYPTNYRIYREACKANRFQVGEMLITEESSVTGDHKLIVNFPTKRHWKYPSKYEYISSGLIALRREIEQRHIQSIAIPPLGSHNGGLEWSRVKEMIEQYLAGVECDVYLYEPTDTIVEKMKSERISLTPARAMLLLMFEDLFRYGEFASVFAAEKIIYFLQKFGAKEYFRLDFKPYYYGPYSGGKVAHVLYYLNGSYITGMGSMDNSPFSFIWLADDAAQCARDYLANYGDDRLSAICERTKNFLAYYYSNHSLELLSSVDYILENSPELSDWRERDENEVREIIMCKLAEWNERKKRIFNPSHVETVLRHLKSISAEA